MKVATFAVPGPFAPEERVGAVREDGRLVDLQVGYALYLRDVVGDPQAWALAAVRISGNMVDFISGGEFTLRAAREGLGHVDEALARGQDLRGPKGERAVYPLTEVALKAPILRPPKIISTGRNYVDHQVEMGLPAYDDFPRGFVQLSACVIGPDAPIVCPRGRTRLDYEVELCAVIGRRGKYIDAAKAYDYVWGYTIINDIGERDWQVAESKKGNHLLGKNLDTFAPLGPWIVTRDEIPDPMDLAIGLRVNGQVRQSSRTKQMVYSLPRLIAHWSHMTLEPGDVITTGSPAGVAAGHKGEPSWYLRPGDLVEAEVERIGVLRNPVVAEG